MLKDEIVQRLEKIAKHAVHIKGEEPYVMSLDDGVAIHDAIDMIKSKDTVETCTDCVSRQAAIDAILDLTDFASVIELFEYVEDHDLQDKRSGGIIDAIDAVLLLPSVQHTATWELDEQQEHVEKIWHCSNCGYRAWGSNEKTDFCGGCGARMEETDEIS